MELNLYEINEFNKELKSLKDLLENEDNKKVFEYSSQKLEELEEELKSIQIHQIQNDEKLTGEEWLKKDFLEKEISKHEEKISNIENERKETSKKISEMRLQKEDIKRQLNLKEAEIEIQLAELQKEWREAASEQNENKEKIKQLRLANRELSEDSSEHQNNLNEILKLQNENKKLQAKMRKTVITSKKGMELKKQQDEIKAMKNILESEVVLEGIENQKKDEPKKDEPKKDEPKKDEPKKDEPKKDEPKKDEPKKDEPKKDEPKIDEPRKDEPKKDEPKIDEPKKDEPKKDEPKIDEPRKDEPKKDEPKIDEPKKDEPKIDEPRKDEPKKDEPKKDEPKKVRISKIDIDEFTGNVIAIGEDGSIIEDVNSEYDLDSNFFKLDKDIRTAPNTLKEIEEFMKSVYNKYEGFDSKTLDSRIIQILVNRNELDMLKQYVLSIADKEVDMPFELNYDLRDIYQSNKSLKEIKKIQKFSKIAYKQNKEQVQVRKDNIVKRAIGNITKRVQETSQKIKASLKDGRTKELSEGNEKIEETKEEKYAKYMEGKYGHDWVEKTGTSKGYKSATKELDRIVSEGRSQFEESLREGKSEPLKIDHEKAAKAAEGKAKENSLEEKENFDI